MNHEALLALLADLYNQIRAQAQEIAHLRAALAEAQQAPPDQG